MLRSNLISHSFVRPALQAAGLAFGLAAVVVGCTRHSGNNVSDNSKKAQKPSTQDDGGSIISSGVLPKLENKAEFATLPGGLIVPVTYIRGVAFVTVEGTLADRSFGKLVTDSSIRGLDRLAVVEQSLRESVQAIQNQNEVLQVKTVPEVGYLQFMMPYESFNSLSALKGLTQTLLLSPVAVDTSSHIAVQNLSKTLNQELKDAGVATFSDSFSGLKRIGIEAFEKTVAAEIPGAKIDGSSVKVGVTDTGVTYNHPAFFDAEGKSRITYMKDFTNEGTFYFSPEASFGVRKPKKGEVAKGENPDEILLISAQYLSPSTGLSKPLADAFNEIKDLKVLVSAELKSILLAKGNGARLAVLTESAFANVGEKELVDINGNGTSNDNILAIYVPSQEKGQTGSVYLALGADNDFRKSTALGDFNTTKSLVSAYQEKFGFQISQKVLTKGDEAKTPVDVIGAAVVGYDPGNHGSHVSGIIGARKIISNDADGTYARGVAPNVELMVNRVCANQGGCSATEAIIDLSLAGAEVINMSLGGLSPFNDGYGVQETIINRLTLQQNTLFVISAGNSGPGRQTVGSPSVARLSLSVGASASRSLIEKQYNWPGTMKPADSSLTTEQDFMLFFSSRGPTAAGGFKPNISAPGTELSSVQLNAANGARSGLDVYWGTSMAAPTAAGAAALLLDAAKKYNALNPSQPLALDAISLRSSIIEGAKPFDVSKFNPKSGEVTKGNYTWIDQGAGLIDLPTAWEKLKALSKSKAQSAVTQTIVGSDGKQVSKPVTLDYEVRVLRKFPNGQDFTGSVPVTTPTDLGLVNRSLSPKFGRGVWIDPSSKESLYEVQIARRLPLHLLQSAEAGELMRQLNTSAESFELETEIYGSDSQWIKAGTLNNLDCAKSKTISELTIIGQGPTDTVNPDGTGTSAGLRASNLYVCVNPSAIKALPPGDHGAIVKAYRKTQKGREAVASFEVPVYLTKPHQVLEGSQKYQVSGVARSFEVQRNYVVVPEGTTVVNVSLEVADLKADGSGCSGVELMAYEAINTAQPKELAPRPKAIASNCELTGAPGGSKKIGYSRSNPNPGVWDLHVFGRYQFDKSPYTLTVEYAKIASTILKLSGLPAVLNGSFAFDVLESTFAIEPSSDTSEFSLDSLVQTVRPVVKQKENLAVPNADGQILRSYDDKVTSVTFNTFGAATSDIDLEVYVCESAVGDKCAVAASSGTATDVETATIAPAPGKFYKAVVVGYDLDGGKETEFTLQEQLNLAQSDSGTLLFAKDGSLDKRFDVTHALDLASSKLLQDDRFKTGKYGAKGAIVIRTKSGSEIAKVPVAVSSKDDISSAGKK